ncbi:HORMA-domain-containing protein [Epithele typhae]|uniref:HORMA-domain-containing protein n=1 Tax=Epithele typhae TaxID=378194 RepID=UPI002007D14C|nr:HORMA-domain-containing protein [Epithele typhae]KAH9945814.1 HORMA-domain-containing protein [Epithele typhae]
MRAQVQAQRTDVNQKTITAAQSLQSVQTLLRAGLGCIAYLRDLLPSDNFVESQLTSEALDSASHSHDSSGSSFSSDGRRNASGFKVRTIQRGVTNEADKLLEYLEVGIFDALEKQYLRSIIFAIYLDDQDPNNIVEAYTFNFSYCTVPGTQNTIPIMSLDEELTKMSLSGHSSTNDPVAAAMQQGRRPTLGEVKRSLKTLVKTLIQAITQMDPLPNRRFATFKLFYHDNTPEDYEPPHFRAGDVEKDRWFLSTHTQCEIPDHFSSEDCNAFQGTMKGAIGSAPPLTPVKEIAARGQQIQEQRRDAEDRTIMWDGDFGHGRRDDVVKVDGGPPTKVTLLGIRGGDGLPVPLVAPQATVVEAEFDGHQYVGEAQAVPSGIAQLMYDTDQPGREVPPTQVVDSQDVTTPKAHRLNPGRPGCESPLPPSDSISSVPQSAETIDTQHLKDIILAEDPIVEDSMILDTETQQIPAVAADSQESIQSFSQDASMEPVEDLILPECECGVQVEDCDLVSCKGGCERRFHLWCMGFHSSQDHRVPEKFICFECRVKADCNWHLIEVHGIFPHIIARFKDLAIQRRGIKIFETHGPDSPATFTKLIGCESTVAGQVFKRLEAEGFIAQEIQDEDESGFMQTTTLATRQKAKGAKGKTRGAKATTRRKNMKKPVYVFVQTIRNDDIYKDYFNPSAETERRLLRIEELRKGRSADTDLALGLKKIKISLPVPVDLEA